MGFIATDPPPTDGSDRAGSLQPISSDGTVFSAQHNAGGWDDCFQGKGGHQECHHRCNFVIARGVNAWPGDGHDAIAGGRQEPVVREDT